MTAVPPVPGTMPVGALAGIRVLDLSGPIGNYCSRMFADLGADVVLIEPPEGNDLRRDGPFIDNIPGAERSLPFTYINANKRGIVLDLDSEDDRAAFAGLAACADLVIESGEPGALDARGIGYRDLSALNPHLVMTSITPFGQTGPYAHYLAEDLVGLAMGGLLYLAGYPDTAPMAAYGRQGYAAASMFAAVGSMMALLAAETRGSGEQVDISMQECVVMGLETAAQFYDLEGTVRKRYAGLQRNAGTGLFPCKDGYVLFMAGGVGGHRFWKMSTEWLVSQGVAGAEQFREPKWQTHEYINTPAAKDIFYSVFVPFSMAHTKLELYEMAQAAHLPIAPLSTTADLVANPQLKHRGFFTEMQHPLVDQPFLAPGAPYRLSATPWSLSRPAPTLGEHTAEILDELRRTSGRRAAPTREAVR